MRKKSKRNKQCPHCSMMLTFNTANGEMPYKMKDGRLVWYHIKCAEYIKNARKQ